MRRVSLVLALSGCNQIYDLEPTRVRDAGNADAGDRVVQLAVVLGASSNANDAPLTYQPLPDAKIKLALLDDPLRDVAYADGVIDYPFAFGDRRWRLEYNPPFDVAHELQWDPSAGVGFVTVPVVGRIARTTPVADTGYTLSMKVGGTNVYTFSPATVVYTTGYWSAAPSPFSTNTPSIAFTTATSLEGPRGTPAAGDVVVAVDYTVGTNNCKLASISGGAILPAPEPGVMKPVELASHLQSDMATFLPFGEIKTLAGGRLILASGATAVAERLRFGRIAHSLLPAFTTSIDDIPAPPMVTIADCPTLEYPPVTANDIGGTLGFTRVFHGALVADRTVAGARLRSSIAFVGRSIGPAYVATFEVPLAIDVKLDGEALTESFPAGARTLSFAFDRPSFLVDYYEATLYRIESSTLVPVRVYAGLDVTAERPALRIDPTLVTAGIPHVFAIRTYRGRPRAPIGDFRAVDYLQTVGTIFTPVFQR